jgi:hypothetical protein
MTWTWEGLATTRAFWALVVGFRVWNALFVRTAFNPDEFWQSTEVAHRMVFGYGHLYVCVCATASHGLFADAWLYVKH